MKRRMVKRNRTFWWGCWLLLLTACAGSTARQELPRPAVPVVVRSQVRPGPEVTRPAEQTQEKEEAALLEGRQLESFPQRLKSVPRRVRSLPKDEKVYPVELNLQGADLVEAIKVLADILGLNYMLDPKVKGTVNVRASGKLTRTELLNLMDTMLLVNGAAMVREGKIYKIVPAKEAVAGALPVVGRGESPEGMTAQVVFLDQTPAKEMAAVLKPLLSPAGSVAEAAGNSLILIDSPANIDKLLKLVHLIDNRALEKMDIRIIKVNNADPAELIGELETIFAAYGALTKKESYGVNFLPLSRLNGILVLAPSAVLMQKAVHWITQLDSKTDVLANVHVYHVENYKARNLADLVTQLYGGTPSAPILKEVKTGSTLMSAAFSRTRGAGTGAGAGPASGILGTQTGPLGGLQTEGPGARRGVLQEKAAEPKEKATPAAPTAEEVGKQKIRIIPDEENNLVVVMAPPNEWRVIHNLLRRLDIMPRQVLNEVLIAEVRLTGELRYGIEWFFKGKVTTPQTDTSTSTATTPVFQPLGTVGGAFGAGFSFVAVDVYNTLRAFIQLLAEEGKVNVLASPHIMAANNQEALIQIGDEVPVLSSQAVPLISQQTSFATQTINYRSTGIILSVKPQINAKGLVTLDIAQEVSSAVPTVSGVRDTPTISIRQAKTTLVTADNQTIVLGGLIREDTTRNRSGIPGLRNLPLFGPLFGRESQKSEKTELIVLITPHIVHNLEEGARLTQKMKESMLPGALEPQSGRLRPQPPPAAAPQEVAPPAAVPQEVAPPSTE